MTVPVRGRVYWADIGYGEKPFLCVSNNARNNALDSCLVARITTSAKPELASVVPLAAADPLVGSVLCDDIVQLYREEIRRAGGALSLPTMMAVAAGLRSAFSL